jgi:hypothetical protein
MARNGLNRNKEAARLFRRSNNGSEGTQGTEQAQVKKKAIALAAGLVVLATFVATVNPASSAEPTPKCKDGSDPTKVTTGIAQMVGCWTKTTVNGADIYRARFDAQPSYGEGNKAVRGVDLNGFLIGAQDLANLDKTALEVNTKTQSVRAVEISSGDKSWVRMYSMGWPDPKNPVLMGGDAFVLNFTAPGFGSLLIEDFRLGSNQAWSKAFDGWSPIGDGETPAMITEGGKGSMDFTVQLSGIFTLKGHPQSVTIKIPTAVGEGAKIDGFHIHLQEIDGIKLITIRDFEAEYSAEEKKLGGGADFVLPFMGDKGVSFAFEVDNTVLTKATVGVSGIKVPIGAPPAGFITAMNGGFGFKQIDKALVLNLNAGATAEFGPEVPTPWGKVVPLEVSSAIQVGKEGQDFYFHFDGGVKVFRLNVGSVYLKIHTDSGVAFGFSIGVGFPSYSNNPNDPFYIGSSVDGWVAKRKFQFEGKGKVRLVGLDIFEGRILINDKAAGACWKVAFFDGGAVYEYGAKDVQTFGVGCGLDRYREAYPSATRKGEVVASTSRSRKLTTGKRTVVMSVRGKTDAPRFRLTSSDGRKILVPRDKEAIRKKNLMVVVDRANKVTHVAAGVLRDRTWTITPYGNSTPVMGVKTGEFLKPERVRARVVGKGLRRTLIWDSEGNPNTKLSFTEVMRNGYEQPILVTNKVKGRFSFKATKGTHYGKRRLKAYVIHGGTPRQITIEDLYTVRPPARLKAPRSVRAWRNIYTATATWQRVPRATGYVAEIAIVKNGKRVSSYRRMVGPGKRRISIPSHPGGHWAVARVQALNADGVPGATRSRRFRLAPPKNLNLGQATSLSARSAVRAGPNSVRVRAICPLNGHCQTRVVLKVNGKPLARKGFQQVPGTYRFVNLSSRRLAPALRKNPGKLRVVVHQKRIGEQGTSLGAPVG